MGVPLCDGGLDRQRDLFPLCSSLPQSSGPPLGLSPLGSARNSRRRHGKRSGQDALVADVAWSLDALSGSVVGGCAVSDAPASVAQRASLKHIRDCVKKNGAPPPNFSSSGSFSEIRGSGPYEEPGSTVRPYDSAPVSMPGEGNTPIPLAELYGAGGEAFVDGFVAENLSENSKRWMVFPKNLTWTQCWSAIARLMLD